MDEMKQIVDKLKNEIDELKDKLDEIEVDRNKARSSQKIAEWKMRKALAAAGNEDFDEEAPVNTDEEDVVRNRNIHKGNNGTRVKTSNILADCEMEIDINPSVGTPTGTENEIEEKKGKERDEYRRSTELNNIQKQIKDLIKRKKEIKKKEVMQDDTNIENVQEEEKPLPQRTPGVKPRVLSNIQLAPPRKGKGPMENKTRTLDRELGGEFNKERNVERDRFEDGT